MADKIQDGAVISRASSVLYNDFDDGLIMMDIDSGNYFDVDSVGARVWALLEKPMTIAQLCDVLIQEYDVEPDICQTQTTEFVAYLHDKDLVELR